LALASEKFCAILNHCQLSQAGGASRTFRLVEREDGCSTSSRRKTHMANQDRVETANGSAEPAPSDFLWGAEAIGKVIGRRRWPTYHLLEAGEIKSAKKVGGRWVAARSALLRELGAAS
jgi:hypothetical protein